MGDGVADLPKAFETNKTGRQYYVESNLPPLDGPIQNPIADEDMLLQRLECSCGCIYRPLTQCRLFYGGPLYRQIMKGKKKKYEAVHEPKWPETVIQYVASMTPASKFVGTVIDEPEPLPPSLAEVFQRNNAGRDDESLYRKAVVVRNGISVVEYHEVEFEDIEDGEEQLYVKRGGVFVAEAGDDDPKE